MKIGKKISENIQRNEDIQISENSPRNENSQRSEIVKEVKIVIEVMTCCLQLIIEVRVRSEEK